MSEYSEIEKNARIELEEFLRTYPYLENYQNYIDNYFQEAGCSIERLGFLFRLINTTLVDELAPMLKILKAKVDNLS